MSTEFPKPEDIQKKLSEFMKQQFGDKVVLSGIMTQPESSGTSEGTDSQPEDGEIAFDFPYRPRDIKEHLDRFVIRQDEAKKALAIAVCDHYNHVLYCEHEARTAKEENRKKEGSDYSKQNIILLGPTGVGKTYLIRCIAELIGVPFVKADATKFSETGYVGGDVEDLVRELVHRANGNLRLAQYGIIYIDEIDKLATPANVVGRDVSGRGVQTNLLKLMEETEVTLRSATDLPSQLQAAMEFQRKGKIQRETMNTKHILFIVSGAFESLQEIVKSRLKQSSIGFRQVAAASETLAPAEYFRRVVTQDFIKFGFEPEFIGRLPVRVVCDPLDEADLFHILRNSEGSLVRQYERSFRAYGIEVIFQEEGLRAIAQLALQEHTGARGLMTVCERLFRDFKFHLPSTGIHRFTVNEKLVLNPQRALQELLAQEAEQERSVLETGIQDFCTKFAQRHHLILKPEATTIQRIVDRALQQKRNVRDVCQEIFKDYEFGLNLVKKNTGQSEFTIPEEVLENPDQYLSKWVVGSYKNKKDEPV